MHGARETIAKVREAHFPSKQPAFQACFRAKGGSAGKGAEAVLHALQAVTLECMRAAHRQNRQCYLYAFGGPGEVQELALDLRVGTLHKLLAFLRFSFGGGTDVDRPLEMSLDRLQNNEWKQASFQST